MVKYSTEELNHIFHALADPTRRDMMRVISKKEMRASDLAKPYEMSLPAVSKHLKVLERADFIHRRVQGRTHWIRLNHKAMQKAHHWVSFFEQFWNEKFDNLEKYLKDQEV